MTDTGTAPCGTTQEIVGVRFRADRFDAAMARLGHITDRDRAKAAGVARMTLHRWRRQQFTHTPAAAHQVAAAVGLTVDQLFERATRPAAAA